MQAITSLTNYIASDIFSGVEPQLTNRFKFSVVSQCIEVISTMAGAVAARLQKLNKHLIPSVSFDAAGLIALADLETIARRTATLGMAPLVDALLICPGIHRQQKASDLSKAELPPTGAMTTGYVFRIENQATVAFLQQIGVTGQLITLEVSKRKASASSRLLTDIFGPNISISSLVTAFIAAFATASTIVYLVLLEDWWGLGIMAALVLARSINIYLIRWRTEPSWHGAAEPGVQGDLLILISQDRWVRLRGPVDALKAVTSGQWLKDLSFLGSSLEAMATMLVYISAALASNATQIAKILLMTLLLVSAGLLGLGNRGVRALYMQGHDIVIVGRPQEYARRLDLAEQLIKETKRHDWAVGLGMVRAEDYEQQNQSKVVL